jgi:hypothetical protein
MPDTSTSTVTSLASFELTPEQKRSVLNIATRSIVNWSARKFINIAQILVQNITTARVNVLEKNARVVIDAINGIVIYDNANKITAQLKLDVAPASPGTVLWLRDPNTGNLRQVGWDNAATKLYLI